MATETTSNIDKQVEKNLNEEGGGADKNAELAADLDKYQEQKDVISASLTILAAKYGAPEEPEKEPTKDEEPEPELKTELSAETAEKPSEDTESNPPTQADAVKGAENSQEGAVKVEEPEPVTKEMEEKSEDTEKEAIDILEEPINEVDVSTPTPETESIEKPSELVDLEELAKETETSEAESTNQVTQVKEFTEAEERPDKTHVHQSSGKPSCGAVEKDPPGESNAQEVLEVTPEDEEKPQPEAVDMEVNNPSQEAVIVVGYNSQPEAVEVADSNAGPGASEVEEKSFESSEVTEQLEGKSLEANDSVTAGAAKDEVENSESLKEEKTRVVKTAEQGRSDMKVGVEFEHKPIVGSMHIEENGAKTATAEEAKEEASMKVEDEIPVAYSKDVQVGIKLEVPEAIEEEPVEPKLEVNEEPTANGEARDLKKDEAEDFVKTDVQNTKTPLSMKELTANEPVKEKLQSDQLNVEEAVEKDDFNLYEKQDNTVKTVVHKPEQPTEDSDKTNKESEELQEVPVKPKQSNNILSKMKQSLVKAKKAIIGKSPGSKTVVSEVK